MLASDYFLTRPSEREPPLYISPKTNDIILNDTPDFEEEDSIKKAKTVVSKWRQLSTIVNSVQRLKTLQVVKINSAEVLKTNIKQTPFSIKPSAVSAGMMLITDKEMTQDALHDSREQAAFFKALERGSSDDLKYIRERLTKDPKKYYFSEEDPNTLTNKPNHLGYTPLYVACRNGNIELVKLLLDFKANCYQDSKIAKDKEESILVVAARWNHVELVKYLLTERFSWPKQELSMAYKIASNTHIKSLLKSKLGREKRSCVLPFFD